METKTTTMPLPCSCRRLFCLVVIAIILLARSVESLNYNPDGSVHKAPTPTPSPPPNWTTNPPVPYAVTMNYSDQVVFYYSNACVVHFFFLFALLLFLV